MGLGLEGLGVDLQEGFENAPYEQGERLLGLTADDRRFDLVWKLNDKGKTFEEIADILEKEWEDE